jgi:uncharacterized protein (TIGR03083 family)
MSKWTYDVTEPNTSAFRKNSTWPPVPPHTALRYCRRYLVDLLSSHPGDSEGTASARDGVCVSGLIRHLTANSRLAEATLTGRAPARPAALRRLSLPELLSEWERSGTVVEHALHGARGLTGSLLVTDLFTHELEIRRALGLAEPTCHPALPTGIEVVIGGASAVVGRLGLPALRFETTGAAWVAGEGEPAVTVSATPMELYNSLIGRRSLCQIRALQWSADPEPWLRAFSWGPFRPPDEPAPAVTVG